MGSTNEKYTIAVMLLKNQTLTSTNSKNQCLTHLLLKIYKILCISEPTTSLHFRWSSKDVQGNEVLAKQISDLNSNI